MNDNVNYASLKNPKSKPNKNDKCMKSALKTLLLFLNIILFAGSIGVIIWCSIIFYNREIYVTQLIGNYFFLAYYLLLISGITMVFIVIVAFIGIGKNLIKVINAYIVLLILALLIEAASVVFAIYHGSFLMDSFRMDLKQKMTENYVDGNQALVEAADQLQIKYLCCGSFGYSDWAESVFVRVQANKTRTDKGEIDRVPQSCCRTRVPHCGRNLHPSNIHHQGCVLKFYESIAKKLIIVEYVALACVLAQLFGIFLGSMLIILLKKDLKYRMNFHRLKE